MSKRKNYLVRIKKSLANNFNQTKKSTKQISSDLLSKFNNFKGYTKSDSFEDNIDQLILRLQMFDTDLVVPNMDKLNRNQRVHKKMSLVKASFARLNIELAPYGMAAGSVFGPKGSAAGAFTGTYLFAFCVLLTAYERFSSAPDGVVLVPT